MILDTNKPYLTGTTSFIESQSFDMSLYDSSDIRFWVDCDIDPSEDGDYLQLLFSANGGQNYDIIKTWDNNESSYNF